MIFLLVKWYFEYSIATMSIDRDINAITPSIIIMQLVRHTDGNNFSKRAMKLLSYSNFHNLTHLNLSILFYESAKNK